MNKKIWIGIAVIVILAAGYFVLYRASRQSDGTIKIGAAVGLTGICADWGEGELKAEQLAIAEANARGGIHGKQLALDVQDTGCDVRGTVNAMQKLVNLDHVVAILGPTWGDSFQAGYAVSNMARVVAVSPSTALEALLYDKQPIDYVFSTWFPEKSEVDALQRYASAHGITQLVTIHDQDPFGSMMERLFVSEAPAHGVSIVKEHSFPLGDTDFRTLITQMKALKPDGVFVSFQGPQPKADFLKQARELGFAAQVFSSSDIEDPSLLKEYSAPFEGVIYTRPTASGSVAEFDNAFEKMFGVPPAGQSATNAYDAANVLIAALADHNKNGTDIRAAIEHIDMPGVSTPRILFTKNHQLIESTFQIKTVRNGQFVTVP